MRSRLLVSGFDRFGGISSNPSELIAGRLASDPPKGVLAEGVVLPTVFGEAARILLGRIETFRPTHVLALGLGRQLREVHVERFALNFADTEHGDNAGNAPRESQVVQGGPAGYFASLPVRKLVERLVEEGVAARSSTTAGTFVCNDLFFRMMHALAARPDPPFAGFVHVPAVRGMPEAAPDAPPIETLERALRRALEAIL
ncbi:MAG: pyroglutamyl-peptidase I [Deltaproteobacteria bacterium]|nr:pyroglutamyl-peptidase I [Deltaproteobacteria bacterium]